MGDQRLSAAEDKHWRTQKTQERDEMRWGGERHTVHSQNSPGQDNMDIDSFDAYGVQTGSICF
jgi:hypothetical protein